MVQRLPPQNIDAEASVLGALLIDQDALVKVAEFLQPEHFYKEEQHGEIYSAMMELYVRHEPIDLITLTTELKKRKTYDRVGGASYLANLAEIVPTAAHVEQYGHLVKEQAIRRSLISMGAHITELAFQEKSELQEILNEAEQSVYRIANEHIQKDFVPIKSVLDASFDKLDELYKSKSALRGVRTGLRDLDAKLAGLQDSNLIILAARPGIGKTSLAINIAHFASVHEKVPVGIFSLEMSQEELVDRLLVNEADVDAWRLKTGRLEEEDFDRISRAMGELAEAPLYFDDTPGIGVSEMRTKARRLQASKGLKLLIVDYLQLVRGRNLENRVQEVSEISQALKNLARELKIPVLAISQLSRAVESRGTRVPQLADLRESGAIEQDADVVAFLYREDPERMDHIKLLIAKHRNGPVGEIDLIFKGDRVRFYGMEKYRAKAAAA